MVEIKDKEEMRVSSFFGKLQFSGELSLPQRGWGTAVAVDEEVAFSRGSRPLIILFRCKRNLVPQDKIHNTSVARILMATSSSTAYAVPRKARFACKRCYEGSPELFSAGEGYSNNQNLKNKTPTQIFPRGVCLLFACLPFI